MSKDTAVVGRLIEGEAYRDAIHVAIAPVECGPEGVSPGQEVGISDGKACPHAVPAIGIVDPFLTLAVAPGQRFWLFMFPNTAVGVRHHWTHPAFGNETAQSPGVSKAIKKLNELREYGDDPFCCASEAVEFMEGLMDDLSD